MPEATAIAEILRPESRTLPQRDINAARVALLVVYTAVAAVYFSWRLSVFNPAAPVFSAAFYAMEVFGFFWGLLFLMSVLKFPARTPPAPAPGLSVDVFIPTYNEPIDIVRMTAVAALRMSYPHATWILDDGNRPAMRAMADELGCRYLARGQNTHAKAGNLNHALQYATGEFIVLFDADFIARPEFIDRTLGYFADPRIAFVQTPQEFYNYNSFQHVGNDRARSGWSEHAPFYRIIQRGRDYFNATMFCGCAALLRRRALDEVGGVATGTVTEDMHTSVRLHAKGWRSAFHPETLSAGLAPHETYSFRRQRLRWAQGAMQVFRREKMVGRKNSGLTGMQQFSYVSHVMAHAEAVRHLGAYSIPLLTLFTGVSPFQVGFVEWAKYAIPFMGMSLFCIEEFGRGHWRLLRNEIFNLARCPTSLQALLALFDMRNIPFLVTPKTRMQGSLVFPWIIMGVSAAALAVAAFDFVSGKHGTQAGPLTIVALWALLGCVMAWEVCKLSRRCRMNQREFSRFPADQPLILQGPAGPVRATLTELCKSGLSLRPAADFPAGTYRGAVRIDGRELPFAVAARAGVAGAVTGGPLVFATAAEQDDYQYALITDRIRWLGQWDETDGRTLLKPLILPVRRLFGPEMW